MFADIAVPDGGTLDVIVSMAFAVLLVAIFYLCKARIGRPLGALLLFCYVVYTLVRLDISA